MMSWDRAGPTSTEPGMGGWGAARRRLKGVLVLVTTATLLFAGGAQAVDGVLEINQVCAEQTGCFPGDTAGYPVTIGGANSRSYRLTSDLVVPDGNMNGIVIEVPMVSIDLNGFRIVRAGCVDATTLPLCEVTPALPGFGRGIYSAHGGLSVKNGSIAGMAGEGIRHAGFQAHIENVKVYWSARVGVDVNGHAVIFNVHAIENGNDGIRASVSLISNCVAIDNGDDGIQGGTSRISENVVRNNAGDGIQASSDSSVRDNLAVGNEGYGLNLSATSVYSGNVINSNGEGTVNSGINMFNNACNGNNFCP